MKDDRSFDRVAADWLNAGSDRTPPKVIEAVLLAARSTPQERDLRIPGIPWRTPSMTLPLRVAAAIAIVALAAGAALYAFGPAPFVGPAPSASPSPTAAPTSTVKTGLLSGVIIGGGTYPAYTVMAPIGWGGGNFIQDMGTDLNGISVWDVAKVPGDPCHWTTSLSNPGRTVTELVAALVAQKGRNATTPSDVTLDGYSGKFLEWSVPLDQRFAGSSVFVGCDLSADKIMEYVSWMTAAGDRRYQQEPGQVDRLWVLDVGGQRLVVDATHSTRLSKDVLDQQTEVVQSIHFGTK